MSRLTPGQRVHARARRRPAHPRVPSGWLQVVALPGVPTLVSGSVAGRVAYGMLPVAAYLALLDATGSVRDAAVLTAAEGLVGALTFPRKGRLVDRYGRRVLLVLAAVTLVAVVAATGPGALVGAMLLLVGALAPPVTSTVRATWGSLLMGREDLRETGFRLDAGLEEASFLGAPALGGAVAAAAGPHLALVLVGLLLVMAALLLGTVSPGVGSTVRRGRLTRGTHLVGVLLGLSALGQGLVGATIALAAQRLHSATLYGVLLSLDGVGAFVGLALLAALTRGLTTGRRLGALWTATPLLMLPLAFSGGPVALLVTVTAVGLPVGAMIATLNATVPVLEPPSRWNEAYSWLVTCQNLAGAVGFAVGGALGAGWVQGGPALLAAAVTGLGFAVAGPALTRRLGRVGQS